MGLTLEFFSASPEEVVTVFSSLSEEVNAFLDALKQFPRADFSLHLQIPEDMDRLCQSMKKFNPALPSVFRDVLVEQLWDDGDTESLTLIATSFTHMWATVDDSSVGSIAAEWASEFHYNEPLPQTPAYKALNELREVARDAITQHRPLILHLLGSPLF